MHGYILLVRYQNSICAAGNLSMPADATLRSSRLKPGLLVPCGVAAEKQIERVYHRSTHELLLYMAFTAVGDMNGILEEICEDVLTLEELQWFGEYTMHISALHTHRRYTLLQLCTSARVLHLSLVCPPGGAGAFYNAPTVQEDAAYHAETKHVMDLTTVRHKCTRRRCVHLTRNVTAPPCTLPVLTSALTSVLHVFIMDPTVVQIHLRKGISRRHSTHCSQCTGLQRHYCTDVGCLPPRASTYVVRVSCCML